MLYSQINQTLNDITMMTRVYRLEGTLSDDLVKTYKSGKELNEFFSRNRIYFSRAFCERTQEFLNILYELMVDFSLVAEDVEENENHQERTQRWLKILDTLKKDIQPINAELEEEFRALVGVS